MRLGIGDQILRSAPFSQFHAVLVMLERESVPGAQSGKARIIIPALSGAFHAGNGMRSVFIRGDVRDLNGP